MAEYEQSQNIDAPADEVFDWLSGVENLPKYLPPIKETSVEGPSVAGKLGDRIKLLVSIPDRGEFGSEGYFHTDAEARRMEWGAEVSRDYSGWLTVAESGSASEVNVHLDFGERSAEGEIEEESSEDRHPLQEGVAETLESIRRQIEEGSGKLAPSSPTD